MEVVPRKRRPYLTLEKLEMKKTLVALAAVASVSAFAQVTITGVADAGMQTGKEFGQTANMVQQNGSRTSALKFVGVEDLGGGFKAKFQIGTDPSITANNGNNNNAGVDKNGLAAVVPSGTTQTYTRASAQSGLVGAEQNYVGLEGPFGEVQFGTINTNTLDVFNIGAQKFGTNVGGGYKKGIYGDYTRYENSWLYKSPTYNGFSARFLNAPGNDNQYSLTGTTLILRRTAVNEWGANYANGPLTAGYGLITATASAGEPGAGAGVKTTTGTSAVAYDFTAYKLAFGYQTVKDTAATATSTKAYNISLTAPFGNWLVLANTGLLKYEAGSAVQTTGGVSQVGMKNTIAGLGVHYNFSKNTYAYILNEQQTLDANAYSATIINGAVGTATSDHKRTLTAIGISTAF